MTRPRYHHSKTYNRTFGGPVPASVGGKVDDYDIQKKIHKQEVAYHHAKMQDQPFYANATYSRLKTKQITYNGTINSTREMMDGPSLAAKRETKSQSVLPSLHDKQFNPSGRNTNNKRCHDFIGKFPAHVPDPVPVPEKKPPKAEDAPPSFKLSHKYKSRPTPTIACNIRNLRSAGMLFRR